MKTTSVLVALAALAAVVLSWGSGRPAAAGTGHGRYGKPLEGLTMEQRKLFKDGLDQFSETEGPTDGLGPIFNDVSCAACHSGPAVGGSSPITETRAARVVGGLYFELPGGSLFQANAIRPDCAETVPPEANVVAQRQTTPLFGLGLVEAIPDEEIVAYAASQAREHPGQAGRVCRVRDVASGGASRVGRFGWKAQQATLLAFAGDAYVNEMGVTNPLFPVENAPNGDLAKLARCDTVKDPENTDDIAKFTNFMRFLAPPTRGLEWDRRWERATPRIERGHRLFEQIGCGVCHRSGFRAVSRIEAIGGQRVDAFSDFLLHDVGTGDSIVQGGAKGNEFRTAPLWGVSESAPYLHDGSASTITDAIRRHANQGAAAQAAFDRLSFGDQQALLDFLDSI